MAAQPEMPKQPGGWLPSSPPSLNAETGWSAGASSAQAKTADAGGAEHAREQEPQPHYLTTSGLFEGPPRLPTWKEEILNSIPAPAPEPSGLVNDFRLALQQPQSNEDIPRRNSRKGMLALVVIGILLAATAAAIYLNHPRKSVAQFQTAKAWMAKQWASNFHELFNGFHSQAAGRNKRESNRRRGLSVLLREPQSANTGLPAAPASLWETPSNENVTPLVLYVTDSHGRHWILTPTGHEVGLVNHLDHSSAAKSGARLTGPKDCRSLFYPGCP